MGGRGAASSANYGSEYLSVLQKGNIKFLIPTSGRSKAPLETQFDPKRKPKGRVYAVIDGEGKVSSISYYNSEKKLKSTDIDGHRHIENGVDLGPNHTHLGYIHKENGSRSMTEGEARMRDRVKHLWDEFITSNGDILDKIKKKDADGVRELLNQKKLRKK